LLAALWGGSFLLMRIVAPAVGALPTAFSRVALGALGLGAVVALTVEPARRRFGRRWPAVLALGAVNSALPFLLFAFAAGVLPSGYSAILNATAPLAGVLIGAAFFGERAGPGRLGGVVLGIAGVTVLMQAGPVEANLASGLAVAACLAAAACYATAGFLARRWLQTSDGLDSTAVAFGSQLGAAAVLAPFMVVSAWRAPLDLPALSPTVVGALLALGLGCTALAYVLYFRLLADIGPVRTLSVTFLIPLFGVLWGRLVLTEPLSWAHAAGGGLIAAAVWMVLMPAASPPPLPEAGPRAP
jgi:drug/metabolite transporter (DMT)-like permease